MFGTVHRGGSAMLKKVLKGKGLTEAWFLLGRRDLG
jgi:hypothetical protein